MSENEGITKIRAHLHTLTNLIQIILGFAEMDQCHKALPHAKLAAKEVIAIGKLLSKQKRKGNGHDVS